MNAVTAPPSGVAPGADASRGRSTSRPDAAAGFGLALTTAAAQLASGRSDDRGVAPDGRTSSASRSSADTAARPSADADATAPAGDPSVVDAGVVALGGTLPVVPTSGTVASGTQSGPVSAAPVPAANGGTPGTADPGEPTTAGPETVAVTTGGPSAAVAAAVAAAPTGLDTAGALAPASGPSTTAADRSSTGSETTRAADVVTADGAGGPSGPSAPIVAVGSPDAGAAVATGAVPAIAVPAAAATGSPSGSTAGATGSGVGTPTPVATAPSATGQSAPAQADPAPATPALSTPALSTPALATPALATPALSTPALAAPATPAPTTAGAAAGGAQSGAARPGHAAGAAAPDQGGTGLPAVTRTDAPVVLAAPATTGSTAATSGATAPAAPIGTAAPNQPLTQQLARPLFSLAAAGPGQHVVTVQLTPDALGPVTVRAHVTGHGMHVELFAASDAGRDAVRQILPDLRREAAGGTTLDLSAQNRPGGDPADAGARDGRRGAGPDTVRTDPRLAGREARLTAASDLPSASTTVRTAGLDVLA
ncbi:flagellar hook-length control protein FliK [Curtobacterium sp. MCPF17_046]|uniref:flagellar hook-length control protein FliK n=1 Tax=Curtobacterium sp. MCPF17_046 TaxID=2175663 RepID=UPI000D962663|nr:flagellar hook-length control protein FliK [Curtobacterium sp. MCPF17_046]PYY43340.1 hypothetical protein DEJ32_01325 [Curtobacterium sp. MCPF17_046]